ncbi:hypothetical protein IWQ62_004040, partial [Dispira parvispora]
RPVEMTLRSSLANTPPTYGTLTSSPEVLNHLPSSAPFGQASTSSQVPQPSNAGPPGPPTEVVSLAESFTAPLSVWQLFLLNVGLAGLQFTWSVELGYGSPYLLSLGLPKPLLSLVWLAGPLSGLLIQPLIGAISDRSTNALGRRRPFIIVGGVLVVASIAVIAYAKEMAWWWVTWFNGQGKLPEDVTRQVTFIAIGLAVTSFYVLDFSINAVQACLRALVLDVAPLAQQEVANAYAGRMLMLGSALGYFMGFINLVELFPMLGNTQMQVLCIVGILVFVTAVAATCLSVKEKVLLKSDLTAEERQISVWTTLGNIIYALRRLPKPLQQVCNVQFFAWMGWFPVLFYSTTWVVEVIGRTLPPGSPTMDPDFLDRATRVGSFALFLWSLASLAASVVLPWLVTEARVHSDEDTEQRPFLSVSDSPRVTSWWRAPMEVCRRWLPQVGMRRLYTFSHIMFSLVMFSTYFVNDAAGATVIVVLTSIPWAITLWIPFALVGEFVSKMAIETQEDVLVSSSAFSETTSPIVSPQSVSRPLRDNDVENLPNYGKLPHCASTLTRHLGDHPHSISEPYPLGSTLTNAPLDLSSSVPSQMSEQLDSRTVQSLPETIVDEFDQTSQHNWRDLNQSNANEILLPETMENGGSRRTSGSQRTSLDAGIVLGIHNMYVVMPQFVMSLVSSLVFSILSNHTLPQQDHPPSTPHLTEHHQYIHGSVTQTISDLVQSTTTAMLAAIQSSDSVGWVLRIGGVCSLVAAVLSLYITDMRKIPTSFGRRHTKTHSMCRRCGQRAFHNQKKRCASCAYPSAKIRSYNWSKKAKRRKTTGTGRMRYLKDVPRRAKNGFREGVKAAPKAASA